MPNQMPSITLTGDAELKELLRQLPERTLTAASQAMRAVAKPVIRTARSLLVPGHGKITGLLRESIGVRKVLVYRNQGRVVMYIGPRGEKEGFVAPRKVSVDPVDGKTIVREGKYVPQNIAHLVEFGHKVAHRGAAHVAIMPSHLRSLRTTDFVQPRPFLRPAVDAHRQMFSNYMAAALKKVIERRAAKARVA
ncbi:MAG: hypothetical protein EBR82_27895 [Caulobacteraceae bacterium]|nr:hypothetical protein [Caulobacteraceae bacterium]